MADGSQQQPRSFINITKPGDLANPENRAVAASYAANYKTQQRKGQFVIVHPDEVVRNFLAWRVMSVPSIRPLAGQASSKSAGHSPANFQPPIQFGRLLCDTTGDLDSTVFLSKFSEAGPSLLRPIRIILDTGISETVALFPSTPPSAICEAVLVVVFGWLSVQDPDQYLPPALFYQGQILSKLRERLSRGMYDIETSLVLMCVMQTDAILGNETALAEHQKGLRALSAAIDRGMK